MSIMSRDLNLMQQLSSKDLTDEQANALIEKVGEMSAVTARKVEMLCADLYVKQAALKEAFDTGNTSLD